MKNFEIGRRAMMGAAAAAAAAAAAPAWATAVSYPRLPLVQGKYGPVGRLFPAGHYPQDRTDLNVLERDASMARYYGRASVDRLVLMDADGNKHPVERYSDRWADHGRGRLFEITHCLPFAHFFASKYEKEHGREAAMRMAKAEVAEKIGVGGGDWHISWSIINMLERDIRVGAVGFTTRHFMAGGVSTPQEHEHAGTHVVLVEPFDLPHTRMISGTLAIDHELRVWGIEVDLNTLRRWA